ncbi:MAG: class I SAM-dependent methyltransferase [Candidatus Dormibacteria bacterium]
MNALDLGGEPLYDRARVVDTFAHWQGPRIRQSRDVRGFPGYVQFTNRRIHADAMARNIPSGSGVLEIGPGAGAYTKVLAALGCTIVAGDVSPVQLEHHRAAVGRSPAERAVEARHELDVVDLPFPDASFDAVTCLGGPISYVFDHGARAMTELLRVVKPGGPVLVSVMSQGWVNTFARQLWDRGVIDMKDAGDIEGSGDLRHPAIGSGAHQFRGYTRNRLDALIRRTGAEPESAIASWAGPPPRRAAQWSTYLERCRSLAILDHTSGYLLAVTHRPGAEFARGYGGPLDREDLDHLLLRNEPVPSVTRAGVVTQALRSRRFPPSSRGD